MASGVRYTGMLELESVPASVVRAGMCGVATRSVERVPLCTPHEYNTQKRRQGSCTASTGEGAQRSMSGEILCASGS